ncbi:MAG: hypothetical protein IPF54_20040 [Draconibacterium sp.]|nr:hypothetical protein [Draconibacterium sp.]
MGIAVSPPNRRGDLGTTDSLLDLHHPMEWVSRIDSEIITGGGFLELDFDNHRYAGVLDLKLALEKRAIGIIAIGLINTLLPKW